MTTKKVSRNLTFADLTLIPMVKLETVCFQLFSAFLPVSAAIYL